MVLFKPFAARTFRFKISTAERASKSPVGCVGDDHGSRIGDDRPRDADASADPG